MKGSWGLYGHRPRPDSKEWVTNCMRGALAPCQSQKGDVSPGGVWEQAGTWRKEWEGGWCACDEWAPQGNARTWSRPHWDTLTFPSQSCSLHANARACTRLATLPRLWGSLSRCSQGEGSLGTFCPRDMSVQAVPHLPPGSQLDKGTDGLVGAGAAGEHVALVEGLQEADEVGTLGLHRRDVCQG